MYQDVEYKLAQYAQWCGNPLRALDYPGRVIYVRAIPDAIDPEALPEMTDAEAKMVDDALLTLKRVHPERHQVIEGRFMRHYHSKSISPGMTLASSLIGTGTNFAKNWASIYKKDKPR